MRLKIPLFTIIVALFFAAIPLPTSSQPHHCSDIHFIFARGSGSELGAGDYQAFRSSIQQSLTKYRLENINHQFYELGSASQQGYQYPAVSIASPTVLAGIAVSAGEAYSFGASVEQGIAELLAYIKNTTATCPNTKFVLGGYSQGAMVISKALPQINPAQIVFVATFGDPKLYLPEGSGSDPAACRGESYSTYRVYAPDCHTGQGVLGGINPYQPIGYAGKLGIWCNRHDFMCGSSLDLLHLLDAHLAYVADNHYQSAADLIISRLVTALLNPNSSTANSAPPDIAIVIDSTRSMHPYITKYKQEALRLAREALASNGRIALFTYRDLSDPFSPLQLCDFTCTYDQFASLLQNLTDEGGGDAPESALSALLYTMNNLDWRTGANKSIVLLTDSTYHPIDHDGTTLNQVVQRSLEIDPVNIFSITPRDIRPDYQNLTQLTGGYNFNISSQLSTSTEHLLKRPSARLATANYDLSLGQIATFDASASTTQSKIDHYEWDLDCDGVFESRTTTPIITRQYDDPLTGFIQVKVVDDKQRTSTMSAKLTVQKHDNTPPQITKLTLKPTSSTSAQLNFTINHASHVIVAINDAVIGLTSANTLSLSDLSTTASTIITLSPVSTSGQIGTPQQVTFNSTPSPVPAAQPFASPSSTLKVPNAGAR